MKKLFCAALALALAFSAMGGTAVSAINTAQGVTEEMCSPKFWQDRTFIDKDRVLMTNEEILAVKQAGIDGAGTYMFDIEDSKPVNAYKQAQNLNPAPASGKSYYINGQKIDANAYFEEIRTAIHTTCYTETSMEPKYAVTVRCTEMRDIPTVDVLGYSANDTDDELLLESLTVNEPFQIRTKCVRDGKTFYYGYSLNCPGWICGDDLALCSSKSEWLEAWKGEPQKKDFIVVTTDKIILDKTYLCPNASELMLRMGTVLKLVPKDKIPAVIGERGTWNNYIVYIPTRNDDGTYSKDIAMISQHCRVNVGYPAFTQANILDIAFESLGDTYGWAGWLDACDCSLYMAMVYRCFGIIIPRNAGWQQKVPGTAYDVSAVDDETKFKFIETMPAGTMLFFPGHVMMYLGSENGTGYVISALGTVLESDESTDVKSIYSTVITPLTVRRGKSYGYTSWLHNINCVVCVAPKIDISECDISACKKDDGSLDVSVKMGEKELWPKVNYNTRENEGENTLTVSGFGFYTGEKTVSFSSFSDPAEIEIINYTPKLTVDYHSTVIFGVNAKNADSYDIVWYKNGEIAGRGTTYKEEKVTKDFIIQAKYARDEGTVQSKQQFVEVKNSLFDRIIAFFRGLFGSLPEYENSLRLVKEKVSLF